MASQACDAYVELACPKPYCKAYAADLPHYLVALFGAMPLANIADNGTAALHNSGFASCTTGVRFSFAWECCVDVCVWIGMRPRSLRL